jgi:Fis family transcriptional regulator
MQATAGSVNALINPNKPFNPPVRSDGDASRFALGLPFSADGEFTSKLDGFSLESVVEHKISRFLDQVGSVYPDDLHELILGKVEKPLLTQILRRMGGNQVQASRVLGINRNTLRKKMKIHGIKS